MWHNLFSAIGLLLVMEGILPFLSPDKWRRSMLRLAEQNSRGLRVMGLTLMIVGVIVLTVVHRFF